MKCVTKINICWLWRHVLTKFTWLPGYPSGENIIGSLSQGINIQCSHWFRVICLLVHVCFWYFIWLTLCQLFQLQWLTAFYISSKFGVFQLAIPDQINENRLPYCVVHLSRAFGIVGPVGQGRLLDKFACQQLGRHCSDYAIFIHILRHFLNTDMDRYTGTAIKRAMNYSGDPL